MQPEPRLIPLLGTTGEVRAYALVDAEAFGALDQFRWRLDAHGYAKRTTDHRLKRIEFMHRHVMGLGPDDRSILVDHINRVPLDNRRANLRLVTAHGNAQNRVHPGGSSEHRGVTWHRKLGKWQATVKLHGKNHYLGVFTDEEDAARVAADFRALHMPLIEEELAA